MLDGVGLNIPPCIYYIYVSVYEQIVFPIAMFVHSSLESHQPRDEFHRSRLAETDIAEKIPSWGQVGESHELRDVALKVLEGCQRGPGQEVDWNRLHICI
jgi:hypothetical protein